MSRLRFLGFLCCVAALGQAAAAEPVVIDPGTHHLGTPGFPEWQEFEGRTPHGRRLDLTFEARKNETPHTLFLRQWQVKYSWAVLINDRRLGRLATIDTRLVHDLPIAKGLLRDGANKLSIVAPKATDDIEVGDFWIAPGPRKTALGQAWLEVSVHDAIPCRITVTDEKGHLAALHSGQVASARVAARRRIHGRRLGSTRRVAGPLHRLRLARVRVQRGTKTGHRRRRRNGGRAT